MDSRKQILVRTSLISVIGNSLLSLLKIVVGIIAGSMAVLGDGIDSATDVIISLVTLFTARIISRPPTTKYAYGFEKADTVATKILSFVIFFAGVQMLISIGKGILFSEVRELPSPAAIYVTLFSIFGKLMLAAYQFRQGKRVNSSMLIANAKNMRNDVLISSGVLLGLVFTFVFKLPILDSITGLFISFFIIRTSIEIFLDTSVVLMDGVKDTSVYQRIIDAAEQVPNVSNPHRIRSRQLGNMYMISLDIEVNGDLPLYKAHELAQEVEEKIKRSVDNVYDIVVHIEPKGTCQTEEKFGINKTNIE